MTVSPPSSPPSIRTLPSPTVSETTLRLSREPSPSRWYTKSLPLSCIRAVAGRIMDSRGVPEKRTLQNIPSLRLRAELSHSTITSRARLSGSTISPT